MTTTEILTGIKNWVLSKLNLKQDVINDLAAIRSGSQAGSTAVQPSDLSSYFNDASYDTSTHRINFYHGQNIVAYVDASPFIVDGMVDDVRIENGYLVIDFNTASGKQDISIPLTDIFDPSNYYNKTQTDTLLGNKVDKVSGKGLSTNDYTNTEKEKLSGLQNYDDTQVRQLITQANANFANYYTKSESYSAAEMDEALGGKQNTINDLANIRSGAEAGSTAVQPSVMNTALANTVAESGVYDVTANNNNTKFASLSALLSSQNLDTLIPSAKRKGGMSIKFVLSSDNKYVQYMYGGTSTTGADFTNIANWNKSDVSDDLIEIEKNSYEFDEVPKNVRAYINNSNYGIVRNSSSNCMIIPISIGDIIDVELKNELVTYAALGLYDESFTYQSKYYSFTSGRKVTVNVEQSDSSCKYLVINNIYSGNYNPCIIQFKNNGLHVKFSEIQNNIISVRQEVKDVDNKLVELPFNHFCALNTATPYGDCMNSSTIFVNTGKNQNAGAPKLQYVNDTESPFKDYLGKCLTIVNDSNVGGYSRYVFEKSYDEARRPRCSTISVSYFINKSDLGNCGQTPRITFAFTENGAYKYHFDVSLITTNLTVGYINNRHVNNANITLDYSTEVVSEKDGWYQVRIKLSNIVTASSWVGTLYWMVGWNISTMVDSTNYEKWSAVRIVNPQLVTDDDIPVGFNILTDTANIVKNTSNIISITRGYTDEKVMELKELLIPSNINFEYHPEANEISRIISDVNNEKEAVLGLYIRKTGSNSANPCFNFASLNFKDKSTSELTGVEYVGDDITPSSINDTYIGGNHACSDCQVITTSQAHGKTVADIGSIWSNGQYQFVIVGVPSTTTLWVFGENKAVYPLWQFATVEANDVLTHVSGAAHTDSIAIQSKAGRQYYSSMRVNDTRVFLDGAIITEAGKYKGGQLDIVEQYDIFNVVDIIDKIKELCGTFTETPNPAEIGTTYNLPVVVSHNINYRFYSAINWIIITDYAIHQNVNMGYFGYTQQSPLNMESDNIRKLYIPKTLPITEMVSGQERTVDFRENADYYDRPNTINITSDKWENPELPPDRWIMSTSRANVRCGFLPNAGNIGGNNRKNCINNAFYLFTSCKIYPHGIDNKAVTTGGKSYSGVIWRNYNLPATLNNNGVFAYDIVKFNRQYYIYIDFNEAGDYRFIMPPSLFGMELQVYEKSDNVTVLDSIMNGTLQANVSNTQSYGYIVIIAT